MKLSITMFSKLLKSILCMTVLSCAAMAAHAQDARIGIVNTDRIFKEADSAKAAQKKLEGEFSRREKELTDVGTRLKADADNFEKNASTMPESKRTAAQKSLVDQDREFQRKRREFQEDLGNRKNEELQQVLERANRVIKQIAETDHLDLVLQEAVYFNPKIDITDKVIKALNAAK